MPGLRVYQLETSNRLKNCIAVLGDLKFNNAMYTLNPHICGFKNKKDKSLKVVNKWTC